jgi:hypothetical protein
MYGEYFPFYAPPTPFGLPIVSSVIMIPLKDFKPWKIIHMVVLIFMTAYSIFYVYAAVESSAQAALWGVWLYLLTLILLLVFEFATLRIGIRPDRAAQVSA